MPRVRLDSVRQGANGLPPVDDTGAGAAFDVQDRPDGVVSLERALQGEGDLEVQDGHEDGGEQGEAEAPLKERFRQLTDGIKERDEQLRQMGERYAALEGKLDMLLQQRGGQQAATAEEDEAFAFDFQSIEEAPANEIRTAIARLEEHLLRKVDKKYASQLQRVDQVEGRVEEERYRQRYNGILEGFQAKHAVFKDEFLQDGLKAHLLRKFESAERIEDKDVQAAMEAYAKSYYDSLQRQGQRRVATSDHRGATAGGSQATVRRPDVLRSFEDIEGPARKAFMETMRSPGRFRS